jgi:prepilin-type N-terminal cleavage/methylation domain-containing protein
MADRLVSRSRPGPSPCADGRGFTLLEVILAVFILAVVVLLATTALRVGLRAWEAGQRRADLQQENRALMELVSDTLAGAFPYQGHLGQNPDRFVLFQGERDEVRFVTTAPPLALDTTVAPFHAVVLGLKGEDALRLIERLVPTDDPFTPGSERVLSRSISHFALSYRDESGVWQDKWDGRDAGGLPTAIRFELAVGRRTEAAPAVIIDMPLGKRSTPQ